MIDISKNLLASIDPMRKMNEDMQRVLNPMHDIQESMRLVTSNIGDIHSLYSSSAQEFAEQIEAMTNPLDSLQKQMEVMCDPMKEIQKQMESLYSLATPNLSYMDSVVKSAQRFQDSINTALGATSLEKYNKLFSSQMQSYKKIEEALVSVNINTGSFTKLNDVIESIIERETIISSASEVIPDNNAILEELENMKSEIAVVNVRTQNTEKQLEKIHTLILSIKNPFLLAFFISIMFDIIINLISSAIYDYQVKPDLAAIMNPKEQQVQIKKEVIQNAKFFLSDPKQRIKYRIVSTNVLHVRAKASTKSKIIALTFLGEVVEIVTKEKNWCLIKRYDTESETYIQGWAFTTYLAQIR